LDQQLSEKLATEFANAPADSPALWIEATLLAFEQVDTAGGAEARVKIEIRAGVLNDGRRDTGLQKIYERSAAVSAASPAAVADALSRVVETIAAEIAEEPAIHAAGAGTTGQK
jgi:hypothetical protein